VYRANIHEEAFVKTRERRSQDYPNFHSASSVRRPAEAGASDQWQIIPLLLDLPKVKGKPGRSKEVADEWYADRGSDSADTRLLLHWLNVEAIIDMRQTPHGSGLGKAR
jgi:hypothetical protein